MRSSLLFLWSRASGRARVMLAGGLVLSTLARISVLLAAVSVARGGHADAVGLGLVASACFVLQRALVSGGRLHLEADLYRATLRGVLGSDVLDVEAGPSSRIIFEGMHRAIDLLSSTTIALVADAVTLAVVVPVVMAELSRRNVMVVSAIAILAIGTVVVARRWSRGLEARLTDLYDEVCEKLVAAFEARAEIVAYGAEEAFARRFDTLAAAYLAMGRRVALSSALLGRAPIVVGALAIGLAILVDVTASRATWPMSAEGAILALAIPPFVGFVVAVHTTARTVGLVRPFVELLRRPSRPPTTAGDPPLSLPATIEVRSVTFRYADGQPAVLEGVSLSWSKEEPLVLVGPNGSGKTTLLRLLLGFRSPTAGTIRVAGRDVSALAPAELRGRAAYLPQRPYLGAPDANVERAFRLVVPEASTEAMCAALERIDLRVGGVSGSPLLAMRVGELSAGQRQRVAIARLIVGDAAILFLDEPDANLDDDAVTRLAAWIRERARDGVMVAMTAHSPALAKLSQSPVDLSRDQSGGSPG